MTLTLKSLAGAILLTALAAGLSACVTAEEQRGKDLALDNQRCGSMGFSPGTAAMAQCMDTAAANRSADKDRQAEADRQAAIKRQQDQAAWQARVAASDQKMREDANRWQNGDRSGGDDTPANPPTASHIPGMQCDGVGDEATCDAR